MIIPALPVTVTVTPQGAVSVENANGMVGMNRFSERAARLHQIFGPGEHVLDEDSVGELPEVALTDAFEGLR